MIFYATFNASAKILVATSKDGTLQKVISIWMQLCSVAHFSVIKIRMDAISSAVSSAADCTNSNFDDKEMGTSVV